MILDAIERLVHDVVHVDQLLQLLIDQNAARFVEMDGAAFLLLRNHLLDHFPDIDFRAFHPLRRLHHLEHREALLLYLDFDVTLLEQAVLELLAQLLARAPAPFVLFRLGLGELGLDVALR